jgi:hypothetical protein
MMMLFFKRAIDDIFQNRFLNFVTIITISLTILIASAFILFFVNTGEIINSWKRGLRIMAYLKPGIHNADLTNLKRTIQSLDGVHTLRFISKQEAIDRLKAQMQHQSSLFENLTENPLPDSFEIPEYEIMERFCHTVENERLKHVLLQAIKGRRAFRSFKDSIYRENIEKKWFAFKDNAFKSIAVDFLKSEEIPFTVNE